MWNKINGYGEGHGHHRSQYAEQHGPQANARQFEHAHKCAKHHEGRTEHHHRPNADHGRPGHGGHNHAGWGNNGHKGHGGHHHAGWGNNGHKGHCGHHNAGWGNNGANRPGHGDRPPFIADTNPGIGGPRPGHGNRPTFIADTNPGIGGRRPGDFVPFPDRYQVKGGAAAGWARNPGGNNRLGQNANVFIQQNGRPGMNQNANVFIQQNGGGMQRPRMGGWHNQMPREMPKLEGKEKGGWIAAHNKYNHGPDGTYTINDGQYKGYTARYTGKDGVFDMFKDGHRMGQWTSPTKTDKIASPVALDLNGDGRISTTGASTARDRADPNAIGQTIAFDLNGDGVKEQVEWMNGGDGLVVDTSMIGADGSIDGRALMGDQGGQFTDGYAKMAGYDQNGDGQLTGQELGNLGVWVDNGNGIVEQGEIRSLADVGVNSLSTQRNDVVNNNGETLMRSTADVNGQQMMTEDVWFRQA